MGLQDADTALRVTQIQAMGRKESWLTRDHNSEADTALALPESIVFFK